MAENWAIVVGINEYENLSSLKYAQQDAEEIAAWFEKEAGFDEVFLFTNNSPAIKEVKSRQYTVNPPISTTPTFGHLERILELIEELLVSPEDKLWFFFAGHGRQHAGKDYLIISDSSQRNLERNGISVD